MEIICYSGIPGSGKTLDATYDALRHYKKENNVIKKGLIYLLSYIPIKNFDKFRMDRDYYKKFKYHKINNIYSNYPILLDKKRGIYSHTFNIFDLNNTYSFLPNALFICDEVQLYIDSDEYKDKDKNKKISKIAKFCQAARHFGSSGIIFTTQHPSRLAKKFRNVCSRYTQHKSMFKIPILNLGFIKTIDYFNMDDYGKYIPKDREERKKMSFEAKKHIKFINFNSIFSAYDSRYLSNYNFNKPVYNKGSYKNLKVEYKDLLSAFEGEY